MVWEAAFFSVNGQAMHTVEPLHFGNTITRTVMPHIRVPLVFPSQKKKMASLKDFTCEASAFAEAKFDVTNLPTDKLNNFIDEMLLFYKGNLITENISGNKHVFKATLRLDITDPQDAEEFVQCYCDHNNKTIKLASTRYDVYFH